jgi:hypothetical protein
MRYAGPVARMGEIVSVYGLLGGEILGLNSDEYEDDCLLGC